MSAVLDDLFTGLFSGAEELTAADFCLCIAAALLLGAALAWVYARQNSPTRSFAAALAMLPAVVSVVIMMVSGSLGAGVAVAGTFSLVRFRSAPGTAKEICAIFLAMAVGLACGMGYPGFAALFTVIMGAVSLLYDRVGFGAGKRGELRRVLRITVPEDLDYTEAFNDLLVKYTAASRLTQVKTTNLGSLSRLTYDVTLRRSGTEKELIDALRCRNGNLEISAALPCADDGAL